MVGDQEVVGKVVGSGEERRGSEGSMTEVVALVSWVEQSSRVVDGQDVLYLMKSWAREQRVHVSKRILN